MNVLVAAALAARVNSERRDAGTATCRQFLQTRDQFYEGCLMWCGSYCTHLQMLVCARGRMQ